MKVQDLQQFLRSLAQPLIIAEAKKAAKDLEATAAALESFKDVSVEEMCQWLSRAEHYRQTNEHQFTSKKRAPAAPSADRQEAIKQSTQRLLELNENALDADYSPERVKEEMEQLKNFSKSELEQIARELGIAKLPSRSTKETYIGELERKIAERRESNGHSRPMNEEAGEKPAHGGDAHAGDRHRKHETPVAPGAHA